MYSIVQYFPLLHDIGYACLVESISDPKARNLLDNVNARDFYHQSIVLYIKDVDWRHVDIVNVIEEMLK